MKLLHNQFLTLALFLLIIISFFILQPTSASTFQIANREAKWNTFTEQIAGKRMDTKLFWEIREFYSPGNFVYKKEGLPTDKQVHLVKEAGMDNLELDNQIVILEYNAPAFTSYESLIPDENTVELQNNINKLANINNVIAKGENFVIIKTKSNKAIVIFMATLNEMKKANGFLKYEEDDKDFVKGKSWLSISLITLD